MSDRTFIGSRARDLRHQADLSTAELARRLNCVEGHLRNLEGGQYQPSARLLHRLIRELSKALQRPVELDDVTDAATPAEEVPAPRAEQPDRIPA